ncbi:PQQ-binding-like beta-propeller repeat protein [Kitasatospora sp. NPDC004614]|uniref:outer membrane protein assembly factor BamB family protein n=1 Tax=unclassified Kitasatospora TaxID=2633591 RepID=UPI0036B054CA
MPPRAGWWAFNAADGTELWHLELPSEVLMDKVLTDKVLTDSSPVLVRNTLFVPTADRGIYAVDVVNHKLRWTFQTCASIDLPWHLAGNDDLLIAVQGDRVMALPAE